MYKIKKYKILKILSRSIMILAIIGVIFSYYGLEILTYCWHLTHNESIEWYDLKIKIPKTLIVRIIEDNDGNKDLQIYYWRNANETSIFFSRVNYHLKENFDFEKKYEIAGYRIMEKNSDNILGFPCVWIKSYSGSKEQERIYQENIFFKSKNIRITFIGYKEKRHHLLEVINNLEFL